MTDTPESDPSSGTPPAPGDTSAGATPTEPVSVTDPPAAAPTSSGPASATPPVGAAPAPFAAPSASDPKRSWWKKGLIGIAAVTLVGLIFAAGAFAGFLGGRFDRFERRDRMSDRWEEVFGEDSSGDGRGDRIKECFFGEDGDRPQDCPPFSRRGGRGERGWMDEWDDDPIFEDGPTERPVPLPPAPPRGSENIDPNGPGRSDGPGQAVIVYPDGRIVPLEPNAVPAPTTVPAPTSEPVPGP